LSAYRIIGGDVGTRLIFTVREWPIGTPPVPNQLAPIVNLAAATNLRLILIPPPPVLSQGVAQQTVVATLYTDGTDGNLQYTTVAGDVPAVPWGSNSQLWTVRAQYTLSGWSGKSEPDTLFVDP
jgi:hypothetical protein